MQIYIPELSTRLKYEILFQIYERNNERIYIIFLPWNFYLDRSHMITVGIFWEISEFSAQNYLFASFELFLSAKAHVFLKY